MSKVFGGIDNLLKPKHRKEQAKNWKHHMAEVEADRQFRQELQAIKDKMDLFGDDALSPNERAIVDSRPAFFFPEGR